MAMEMAQLNLLQVGVARGQLIFELPLFGD
jgi:hypothetical protein